MPHAQPQQKTVPAPIHSWDSLDLPGGEWTSNAFEHATTDWKFFAEHAGVYAFASRDGNTANGCPRWNLLYVDETKCLAEALPNHPKWAEAEALGATHVVIEFLSKDNIDGGEVLHWVAYCHPPMNADFDFLKFRAERGY